MALHERSPVAEQGKRRFPFTSIRFFPNKFTAMNVNYHANFSRDIEANIVVELPS